MLHGEKEPETLLTAARSAHQFKMNFKNILGADQLSQASYTGPGEGTLDIPHEIGGHTHMLLRSLMRFGLG